MTKTSIGWIIIIGAVLTATAFYPASVRAGYEFRGDPIVVNPQPQGNQYDPVIASAVSGFFVVAWTDYDFNDNAYIRAQRFLDEGEFYGARITASQNTLSLKFLPAAALTHQQLALGWVSGADDRAAGPRFQSYNLAGEAIGGSVRKLGELCPTGVGDPNVGQTGFVSVVALDDNQTMAFWEGRDDCQVEGRIISSAGMSEPFAVSSDYGMVNFEPRAAKLSDGNIAVVWKSYTTTGSGKYIYYQVVDPTGGLISVEAMAADSPTDDFDVAALSDGRFVIVYQTTQADFTYTYARMFTAAGAASGEPRLLDTSATAHCRAAGLTDGGFVLAVWGQVSGGSKVYAAVFDAAGERQGSWLRPGDQVGAQYNYSPDVAASPDGGFVTTWSANRTAAASAVVYVQRFAKTTDSGDDDDNQPTTSPIQDWVETCLYQFWDETPDSSVASYTEALTSGEKSAKGFLFDLFGDDRHKNRSLTDEAFIRIVYKSALGRNPSDQEMDEQLQTIATTYNRAVVLLNVIHTTEFEKICINMGVDPWGV